MPQPRSRPRATSWPLPALVVPLAVAALAAAVPTAGACAGRGPNATLPSAALVSTSQPNDSAALPFTRVYHSDLSAYPEGQERAVRSDAEWQRVWLGAHPNRADGPPPAPPVDFSRDMIVMVTTGAQPTGGVSVTIDAIQPRADGGADVFYTVVRPAKGCMTTQQLTAPVDVVRIARRPGDVRFVRRERTSPC